MIKRKQRLAFRDLSQLSEEDGDTAVKHRVNGRDLNLFKVLMHHPALVRRWTVFPSGGHFAPMEEPERLVEDIRAFFRTLR